MTHSNSNKATQLANDKVMIYHLGRMSDLGLKPNPTNIAKYLIDYAKSGEITKASWHKLRFQVLEQQRRNGYDTSPLDNEKIKPFLEGVEWKKPRKNNRSGAKEEHFTDFKNRILNNRPDGVAYAFLMVCKLTGCRPSEVLNIQTAGTNEVLIFGKKVNKKHKSGLDRNLHLKNPADKEEVARLVRFLNEYTQDGKTLTPAQLQKKAQNDISSLNNAYGLKQRITLKSLRHQMASDLKTAKAPARHIAAVLGHQSTATQAHYGRRYKKSAIDPIEAVDTQEIRDKGKTNPYAEKPVVDVKKGVEGVLENIAKARGTYNLAESLRVRTGKKF